VSVAPMSGLWGIRNQRNSMGAAGSIKTNNGDIIPLDHTSMVFQIIFLIFDDPDLSLW
jgi:hypothetical protein